MPQDAASVRPATGSTVATEARRLEALDQLDILDTPREEAFDRIARLIRNVLDLPVGLVSLIDGHRQWVKASDGLVGRELDRSESLCALTVEGSQPVVVHDALEDARFRDHRFVTGRPHVRCYAGVPLTTPEGYNVGTLCAMGYAPRAFSEREIGILRDLALVAMDELDLRRLAVTDNLTGLMSRGAFRQEAERAIALALRHKTNLAMVAIDLDHFKAINDSYGHGVGDRVLRGVAEACVATQRQSDHVGRLGGEEFGVLLPSTDRAGAMEAAERMRAAVEALRFEAGPQGLGVTASFGIACLDIETKDIDTLLAHADAALYQAKGEGRNRCAAWRRAPDASGGARRRVLKAGRIVFNRRASTIDCTVRTLGETGAGLDVISSSGIPETFTLAIRSDSFETACRIVSQTEKHLEVEFG